MQSNQEILNDYQIYKTRINPVSEKSRKTLINRIKRLGFKPYRDLTENDILNHLENLKPSTRNSYLGTIKTFMKWLYDTDNLPPCVKRIKPIKIKHNEIKYRERVVTEIEYNRLINSASTPRHKAILEAFFWLGVRAGELLSINSDGVLFDGEFTRVVVRNSKTEPREIVHKGRLEYLLTYVESYQPNKDKKGLPLFTGRLGNRLTYSGIEHFIDKLSKNLGLKNITLHDFRHTSISRDRANGIPITHIETKHGLEHGSQVIKIYDHNKTKDYENYLKGMGTMVEPTYEEMKKKTDEIEKLKAGLTEVTEIMQEKHNESERKQEEFDKINELYLKKIVKTQQLMINGFEEFLKMYPKMKKPEFLQKLSELKTFKF